MGMTICRECKHHTYYRTGIDGMVVVDCCGASALSPIERDPVTGIISRGVHEKCSEINTDGECEMFEPSSLLRRMWMRLVRM